MIEVDIYAPVGSSFEYVKSMIVQKTESSSLQLNIHDHQEVDDFIQQGIESVPAVRINQRILLEKQKDESINHFIRNVVHSILREEDYGDYEKIVVPMDFSESAVNAFFYARHMAKYFDSMIKLVHVYHPNAIEVQGQIFIDYELEHIRRKKLADYVKALNQDWIGDLMVSNLVDGQFVLGFPIQEIIAQSKNNDVNFMVVGRGKKGETEQKIFGSVSMGIIPKTQCPLFVVPPEYTFQPFKNIVYTTSDPELDSKTIQFVINLADKFNSSIHLLHVSSKEQAGEKNDRIEFLKNHFKDVHFNYVQVENESAIDGIRDYLESHPVDLVAMSTQKRQFWKNIFHKSCTKAIARITEIPVLVLHATDSL